MKYKDFKPVWKTSINNRNTYRTIFKWGNPQYINEPTEPFYQLLKEKLELTDEDFMISGFEGDNVIDIEVPTRLSKSDIDEFIGIVGKVNVAADTLSRARLCYGKAILDNMRLREENIKNLPDLVLSPTSEEQIMMIVKYCNKNNIAIFPAGGCTNMVLSVECPKIGVRLDLKKNFNKVISFSETDQTITVMPGITGPQLEEILNNAADYFTNVQGRYTCGHIPASYEYSTVGGWVATRGKGQASTLYGGIDDILVSAKYLTPKGIIDTYNCNRGCGVSSLDEVFMGSEGTLAIILSVTLRIKRYYPDNKKNFSYIFRGWDSGVRFVKELAQRNVWMPSVIKLFDVDGTEMIMRMSNIINKGLVGSLLKSLGNVQGKRCVLLGYTEGDKQYSNHIRRNLTRLANRYGANNASGHLSKKWDKSRFNDAYIRDILQDYDVVMDQIDFTVNWSNLQDIYGMVKDFFADKGALNMNHLSHITAHSCTFNIAYIKKFSGKEEYYSFHTELMEMLNSTNALMPKNHSLGRLCAGSLDKTSDTYRAVLRIIKKYLDPKDILNPYGVQSIDKEFNVKKELDIKK